MRSTERLGVLLQGMGAVSSTVIAGVISARKGLSRPVGALTEYARLPDTFGPGPKLDEAVDFTPLDGLVFGGWDIFGGDMFDACEAAQVLRSRDIDAIKPELQGIRPMAGAFDPDYVKRLNGTHVKTGTRRDMAEALRADIRTFKADNDLERCVLINASSTEVYQEPGDVHQTIEAFEAGLDADDPRISPAQLYAYAAIMEGVPYANGTPSLAADIPALIDLAQRRGVPTAGKDFKTGQTLVKTVLAPMFQARSLGVRGWFSTNILGNRDGEVLDEPENFKAKEMTKLGVLDSTLQPEVFPELYGDLYHKVRINYYPPRGDAKEGWDNIDFFGWMDYPMQIKVDFLCRDSILAAPIVLDLARLLDLAARSGHADVQTWLSFYWKSPLTPAEEAPVHDLFAQRDALFTALRSIARTTPRLEVA